jgi:hypothetical protein
MSLLPIGSPTKALLHQGITLRQQSPHSESFPVSTRTVDWSLLANYKSAILEYWRDSWPTINPTEQFREALDVSVALLVGTKKPGQSFDFIILHVLTACHAVRVKLPELPAE